MVGCFHVWNDGLRGTKRYFHTIVTSHIWRSGIHIGLSDIFSLDTNSLDTE
jgi:hypothetical protein